MSEHNKHYDSSLEFNITMYDRLPYDRDIHLCGPENIRMRSGNVIKYYSLEDETPFFIENQDEKTNALLKKREDEILRRIEKEHEEYISEAIQEALSHSEEESNE